TTCLAARPPPQGPTPGAGPPSSSTAGSPPPTPAPGRQLPRRHSGIPSATAGGSDPTGTASGTARTASPPTGRSTPRRCRNSSCDPPPARVPIPPPCCCPSAPRGARRTPSGPPVIPQALQHFPPRRVEVRCLQLRLAPLPELGHRRTQGPVGHPEGRRVL